VTACQLNLKWLSYQRRRPLSVSLSADRQRWPPLFRIADHVRTDIANRPCWTMSLSGPSPTQNATSVCRPSVGQVARRPFLFLIRQFRRSRLLQKWRWVWGGDIHCIDLVSGIQSEKWRRNIQRPATLTWLGQDEETVNGDGRPDSCISLGRNFDRTTIKTGTLGDSKQDNKARRIPNYIIPSLDPLVTIFTTQIRGRWGADLCGSILLQRFIFPLTHAICAQRQPVC